MTSVLVLGLVSLSQRVGRANLSSMSQYDEFSPVKQYMHRSLWGFCNSWPANPRNHPGNGRNRCLFASITVFAQYPAPRSLRIGAREFPDERVGLAAGIQSASGSLASQKRAGARLFEARPDSSSHDHRPCERHLDNPIAPGDGCAFLPVATHEDAPIGKGGLSAARAATETQWIKRVMPTCPARQEPGGQPGDSFSRH